MWSAASEWPISSKNGVASRPYWSTRISYASGMAVKPVTDVVDAAAEDDPVVAGLVVAQASAGAGEGEQTSRR